MCRSFLKSYTIIDKPDDDETKPGPATAFSNHITNSHHAVSPAPS